VKIKLIAFLPFLFFITFFQNVKTRNKHTRSKKPKITHHQKIFENEIKRPLADPFTPIDFTAEGLQSFFENIYNQFWYGQDFLPNNFTHMIQFLKYGKKSEQDGAFFKSVLKLFGNKLKSSTYVNSYAFLDLLKIMPNLTKHYFEIPEINILENNQKLISNLMYSSFSSKFGIFKENPKAFLNDLSNNILETINHNAGIIEKQVNIENLRQSLVKFLELSIGKLIWSPNEHKKIWKLFLYTSKLLEKLAEENIITDLDSLDDISWSLIHRLCFFIEISAQDLPAKFYKKFRNNLASADLFMFKIVEQEQSIKSKHQHLVHALFEGEAKARAYKSGIVLRG